jgi:hypothetical protein
MLYRYEIENELVRQKDRINALINDERYEEATALIDFAEELWAKASYAYKTLELRRRIREEVWGKIVHAEHHKTEEKWRRLYDKLPQAA